MTVKELVELLKTYPQDHEIFMEVYSCGTHSLVDFPGKDGIRQENESVVVDAVWN